MAYPTSVDNRTVIIGGGVHAAILAGTMEALGLQRPIVLEKEPNFGGPFRRLANFTMNSQTFSTSEGFLEGPARIPVREIRESQNYLPNCEYQIWDNSSYREYPNSLDLGEAIEMSLNTSAEGYTRAETCYEVRGEQVLLFKDNGDPIPGIPTRVILAMGQEMRDPWRESPYVFTAESFLRSPFMPSGLTAIVGDGDTANIVAEYLLGMAPASNFTRPIPKFDWYGGRLFPTTKKEWMRRKNARYSGIARHFPQAKREGVIHPIAERGEIFGGGNTPLVNTRRYQTVIDATGYKPVERDPGNWSSMRGQNSTVAYAKRSYSCERLFMVGAMTGIRNFDFPVGEKSRMAQQGIAALSPLTVRFAEYLLALDS